MIMGRKQGVLIVEISSSEYSRTSLLGPSKSTSRSDIAGIVASVCCAIHCAVMPLIVGCLPSAVSALCSVDEPRLVGSPLANSDDTPSRHESGTKY